MANKKQIKELVIQTTSKGTKEVVNEVVSLNEALKGAVTASDQLTNSLKGGAKYVGQIALAYSNATKSINGSLDAVKKLNTALNGDTKKASQSMSAYLDNLQLLNLELNTTSVAANKAANALGRMASATQMDTLIANIEDIAHEMEMLRTTSEKSIEVLEKGFYDLGQSIERTEDVAIDTTRAIGKLGDQVGRTGEKTEKTKKETDLFNNSLRRLSSAGSSSARAFSSLAFGMNPLVAAYAAIAVNIYAVTEAFRVLKESAALQRLEEQTAGFASAMSGLNVKGIAQDIQEASAGALSFGEALKTAVRGVSFDFTRDQLIELTDGARKASIALGIDFADAMDRVIRGISKAEVELLDELGVVTRLETAFSNYIAKAGIAGLTMNKLTDAQRRLALTQEVNYQLQTRYGKSIEKVTTSWEELGVATTDAVQAMLKSLSGSDGALSNLAKNLADSLKLLSPIKSSALQAAESLETYNKAVKDDNTSQAAVALGAYQESMSKAAGEIDSTIETINKQRDAIESLATVIATLATVLVASKLAGYVLSIGGALLKATKYIQTATVAAGGLRLAMLGLMGPIGWVAAGLTALGVGFAAYSTYEATGEAITNLGENMTDLNKVGNATAKVMKQQRENASLYREELITLIARAQELKKQGLNVKLPDLSSDVISKMSEQQAKALVESFSKYLSDMGGAVVAFEKDLTNLSTKVGKIYSDLGRPSTDIDTLVDSFSSISTQALGSYTSVKKLNSELGPMWENFKASGFIAQDMELTSENLALVEQKLLSLQKVERAIQLDRSKALLPIQITGQQDSAITIAENELRLINQQLSARKAILGVTGENFRYELQTQKLLTEERIRQLNIDKQLEISSKKSALALESKKATLELTGKFQSESLEAEREALVLEIKRLEAVKRSTEEQKQRLAMLDIEISKQKQLEAIEMRMAGLDIALQNQQAVTAKAGTEQSRVASLEKELALKKAQIEANTKLEASEKARQLNSLALEQASVLGMKDGAMFKDAANVMGNIAGLEGLSDLQSTFSSSMSGISDTYSQFLTDMEGKGGSFMDYLTGNIDGMSNVLSSSLSLAQAAFSQISDAKIASIDSEIEAEKRRDGKSEESLAKIKKLQAQKIKEETKAKKASVIMSTATAVMQAFAQMGPLGAPFAAALGAIGMLQLATIDKAASGQLAGLGAGVGSLAISGGNRSNEIDVSRGSNAGELAYVQGAKGTGTSGNFTPGKAVGGYNSGGTGIVVGESGPEIITPAMPVNVTPAGQVGQAIQLTFSPVFHTNTVDSSGFESLTQRYSKELYEGLEKELRARNRTLTSL